MARKQSATGFSTIAVMAVVVVLAVVGLAGWQVYRGNKHTKTPDAGSNPPAQTVPPQQNTSTNKEEKITLLGGKVSFTNDGTWKVATGGYYSIEQGRCGRGPDFDQGCLDHKMLIPANETFTNPDQYQVNIMVFRAEGVAPRNWEVDEGYRKNGQSITIDSLDAYRYEVPYPDFDQELRRTYAIAWGDKMIVVKTTFFKGNYYGYKSTTDYTEFKPKVDQLVQSLIVSS